MTIKVQPEYNLRLEICSAELFNELRGLIQVSVYKDFREFPFPKLQEHRGLKNNTLCLFSSKIITNL